jgi:hypothetical protein
MGTVTVYNSSGIGKPQRVSKATATLPQSTSAAKFTVSGGSVLICDIVGKVTTAIQAGANNMKLISNPTVGADVDLCAVLDIAAAAVGSTFHVTGTLTDAMVKTVSGAGDSQAAVIQVEPGTIDLSCDASKTGAIKWTLFYIPLESGAKVS